MGMRAKCSMVCPWENNNCCMACLLSKQDDFMNQVSMLKTLIKEASHECIFLPKFHCKLNPIEMVSLINILQIHIFELKFYPSVLGVGQVQIPTSSKEDI